jgi:hypothetical protein
MTVLVGYAYVWRDPARDGRARPIQGAFREFLASPAAGRVQLLFEHDDEIGAIAAVADGSLSVFEGAYGLGFRAEVAPRAIAWLEPQIRAHRLGVSIGWRVIAYAHDDAPVTCAALEEISLTGDPNCTRAMAWFADQAPISEGVFRGAHELARQHAAWRRDWTFAQYAQAPKPEPRRGPITGQWPVIWGDAYIGALAGEPSPLRARILSHMVGYLGRAP